MLSPTSLLADALGQQLAQGFRRCFGDTEPQRAALLQDTARLVVERLGSSDALYHNAAHTALVTAAGQDILHGLRLVRRVSAEDWLHFLLAALLHDIGYRRGICRGDTPQCYVIDAAGGTVALPRGASDAALTPYHVDRSKLMVRECFAGHPLVDVERIADAIEMTRFPVPAGADSAATDTEPGLVRAADLIGQLGDPLYPSKLNALYREFAETGVTQRFGYASPADIAERYPAFFWSKVEAHLVDALRYLDMTAEGRHWVAHLRRHVLEFAAGRRLSGPQPIGEMPRPPRLVLAAG